jgi:hypothetical protein
MLRLPYRALAAGLFSAGLLAAASDPGLLRAQSTLARLPLRFEANQGQWNPAVRYAAHAGGYTLLLGGRGPSLILPGDRRVDMGLAGSNAAAPIEALDRLPTRTGYFIGRRENWHTGIANYARVRYRGVYPGIDVVYYGNQGELEYDFVVAPGANPRVIRFQVNGPGRLHLTPEGDLAIETGGRRILQRKPLIYQQAPDGSGRREVAGRYTLLAGHTVGVRVDGYDRARPLVIDPVVEYCTYFGGPGNDEVTAMKLGPNGQLYIAGSTDSTGQPAVGNYYSNVNSGIVNAFLAVVDTTQSNYPVTYFSYFGGTGTDIPLGLDVDAGGFAYLVGTTTSADFPLAGVNIQSTNTSEITCGFLLKVNPAQSGTAGLWYGTYLGSASGLNPTTLTGVAADPTGLIDVIGSTQAGDYPTTAGSYAAVLYGSQDAVLSQIDPNAGVLVYSTYLGGELTDYGRAIAVDAKGLVYFAVDTDSTLFPAAGYQYQSTLQGVSDIVVGVMDFTQYQTASLIWDTYFGGSDADQVRAMFLNSQGNMVLTGYTLSQNFPVTADAAQSHMAGNGDAIVSVVNVTGTGPFLLYSTYLGGSQGDVGYGVATDPAGNLYVTGYTLSPDFPVTSGAPQPLWGQGVDVFAAEVSPGVPGSAGIRFGTYFGVEDINVGDSIVLGADGTMYMGGFGGVGLPSSADASQFGYGGGSSDGFLIVLSPTQTSPQHNSLKKLRSERLNAPRQ